MSMTGEDVFVCDQCGFEAKTRMALVGHKNRKDHRQDYRPGTEPADDTGAAADPPPAAAAAAAPEPGEAPPSPDGPGEVAPRKPGLLDRFRSRRGRGRGGQHQGPATAERPPRKARPKLGRRIALDMDISDIWAFGGRRLENTAHYPTGRMLQYQAPAAGVIIDRAVAGTLPDRVLFQPLARNRDKYEDVGFLLAGPLLTFSITTTMAQMQAAVESNDKEAFDDLAAKLTMQREMFTWVLQMMLPRLAAGAKLAREKKEKRDAQIAEAFPELGDEDPAEVLATMLFSPPTFSEGANQNGKPDPSAGRPDSEGSMAL